MQVTGALLPPAQELPDGHATPVADVEEAGQYVPLSPVHGPEQVASVAVDAMAAVP